MKKLYLELRSWKNLLLFIFIFFSGDPPYSVLMNLCQSTIGKESNCGSCGKAWEFTICHMSVSRRRTKHYSNPQKESKDRKQTLGHCISVGFNTYPPCLVWMIFFQAIEVILFGFPPWGPRYLGPCRWLWPKAASRGEMGKRCCDVVWDMGVSMNGGTRKWLVYKRQSH